MNHSTGNRQGILWVSSRQGALVLLLWTAALRLCLVTENGYSQAREIDYLDPQLLIGNICALGADPTKCLFNSERRAARSDESVRVGCDYTYPDGSLAARDRIVYKAGRLVSFEEELFQTKEKGSARVLPDPKNPSQSRIFFEYVVGQGSAAKSSSASESLAKDTLIDDMIPEFIVSHWQDLETGGAAKFRYIVLSRKETVGFKLTKESESIFQEQPVVRIKMEPTSFIIAKLVDPLFFVVEKGGKHRILQYIGRTTPLIREGNKWKDLDATTIFDWTQNPGVNAKVPLTTSR